MATERMITPEGGGDGNGSNAAAILSQAIDEARAFNTSWRQALAEITSALQQAQSQILEREGNRSLYSPSRFANRPPQ